MKMPSHAAPNHWTGRTPNWTNADPGETQFVEYGCVGQNLCCRHGCRHGHGWSWVVAETNRIFWQPSEVQAEHMG